MVGVALVSLLWIFLVLAWRWPETLGLWISKVKRRMEEGKEE